MSAKIKKANWLELFYDLIFVVAIAKATHVLTHVHHGHLEWGTYLKYFLIMVPIWMAWSGYTLFANRFHTEDSKHKVLALLQMLGAVFLSVFIGADFEKYYLGFLLSYTSIRLLLVIMYIRASKLRPELRVLCMYLVKGFTVGIFVCLSSIFFSGILRYMVLNLGIFIEILCPILGRHHLKEVPVEPHHLPERYALLTIIVLGESVLGLSTSVEAIKWTPVLIISGVTGFILICTIWWMYFENLERLILGKYLSTGQAIIFNHLFIYIGLGMLANVIRFSLLQELKIFDFKILSLLGSLTFLLAMYAIHFTWTDKEKRPRFLLSVGVFLTSLILLIFLSPNETVIICGMTILFLLYVIFDEVKFSSNEEIT
ncbi:MAG: low temperature requirement protein A [Desulfobacteraceae bacterium]|nr:low temperature requirement protein A [Desulfobacteraceae bacterium]